mgnify:CR=1 FL=1
MPRYRYQCTNCNDTVMVFHLISETHTDCRKCNTENSMKKMLTTPLKCVKLKGESTSHKVGEITKEYIEANKEILEEEKQKARNETYEPS